MKYKRITFKTDFYTNRTKSEIKDLCKSLNLAITDWLRENDIATWQITEETHKIKLDSDSNIATWDE